MFALHKKQIKLRSDNFCRGEEQTSVYNLIFWTEVEQFSRHGRSNRCKTELVKTVSLSIYLFLLETFNMRNVVETLHCIVLPQTLDHSRASAIFPSNYESLTYLWLKPILFPLWKFILCYFIFLSFIKSVYPSRTPIKIVLY